MFPKCVTFQDYARPIDALDQGLKIGRPADKKNKARRSTTARFRQSATADRGKSKEKIIQDL